MTLNFEKTQKKILLVAGLAVFLFSLLLIPSIQNFSILIIENILIHRKLGRTEEWISILQNIGKYGFLLFTIAIIIIFAEERFMESKWLKKALSNNAEKRFRLSFITACATGFITHLYIFTNMLLCGDSVDSIYTTNNHSDLGRFFLQAMSEFSTRFQMPVVIGLISIAMLALTAILTIYLLDIKNPICVILTSAFIVTFPPVTFTLSLMFTADAYFIGLFLNTLAVYFVKKCKYGWFFSSLLLALACGIYQAYICYAIGLFIFDCILALINMNHDKTELVKIVKRAAIYIAIFCSALILYYATVKIKALITHSTLSSYQNIDSISITNIKGLLSGIPLAYKKFIKYFSYLTVFYKIVLGIFGVLSFGCLLYFLKEKNIYKNPARLWLLILMLMLVPLAINFVTVFAVGSVIHILMTYAFVLLFIFAIKLIDLIIQTKNQNPNESNKKSFSNYVTIFFLMSFFLIWNNFCIANLFYLRLQISYEHSFALANRIVTRIESVENYSENLPVAIIGKISNDLYGNTIPTTEQYSYIWGGGSDGLLFNHLEYRTRNFLNYYIGIKMPKPSREKINAIYSSETVNSMPCYPAKDSVKLIDNVIVIKLSND